MNITIYMLPDMLSLKSLFLLVGIVVIFIYFFINGIIILYVSMLNQTPKNVEYYIT